MLAITAIIVVVRIHWFDVGDRLQNAHWGDPVVPFLNDIPRLPCPSLLVDHAVEEAVPPRQFRGCAVGV